MFNFAELYRINVPESDSEPVQSYWIHGNRELATSASMVTNRCLPTVIYMSPDPANTLRYSQSDCWENLLMWHRMAYGNKIFGCVADVIVSPISHSNIVIQNPLSAGIVFEVIFVSLFHSKMCIEFVCSNQRTLWFLIACVGAVNDINVFGWCQ